VSILMSNFKFMLHPRTSAKSLAKMHIRMFITRFPDSPNLDLRLGSVPRYAGTENYRRRGTGQVFFLIEQMFEKCIETIIYNGDHRNENNTTVSKNAAQKSKGFKASLYSLTHVEPNHSRTSKST